MTFDEVDLAVSLIEKREMLLRDERLIKQSSGSFSVGDVSVWEPAVSAKVAEMALEIIRGHISKIENKLTDLGVKIPPVVDRHVSSRPVEDMTTYPDLGRFADH